MNELYSDIYGLNYISYRDDKTSLRIKKILNQHEIKDNDFRY